jgi:hypothetical protein
MSGLRILLVGDNPFHGVSHLSQERTVARGNDVTDPGNAAKLVTTSLDNGASGFMFTVSETTLSILRTIGKKGEYNQIKLYALVPYPYQLVRSASAAGGVLGLARNMALEIIMSGSLKAITNGFKGVIRNAPNHLLESYLVYELLRLNRYVNERANLVSLLLHELVTDMALALDMDFLFKTHISLMRNLGVKPGFETRNFAYLVKKFEDWRIDSSGLVIAAPFNPLGFQMSPSREECERALEKIPQAQVIAFSTLAAGYVKLTEAVEYVTNLPNISGVAVGVSRREQAYETFKLLRERFSTH